LTRFARAGGEAWVADFLVLDREVGKHSFGGSDLVHSVEVNVTQLFDIHRSSILLPCQSLLVSQYWARPYFIGLVIVLRVVLEDFGFLGVLEVAGEVVEVYFFAPFLTIDEPMQSSDYDFPWMASGAYIFSERATSNFRARRNRSWAARQQNTAQQTQVCARTRVIVSRRSV